LYGAFVSAGAKRALSAVFGPDSEAAELAKNPLLAAALADKERVAKEKSSRVGAMRVLKTLACAPAA
jgi:hypothetical protein